MLIARDNLDLVELFHWRIRSLSGNNAFEWKISASSNFITSFAIRYQPWWAIDDQYLMDFFEPHRRKQIGDHWPDSQEELHFGLHVRSAQPLSSPHTSSSQDFAMALSQHSAIKSSLARNHTNSVSSYLADLSGLETFGILDKKRKDCKWHIRSGQQGHYKWS